MELEVGLLTGNIFAARFLDPLEIAVRGLGESKCRLAPLGELQPALTGIGAEFRDQLLGLGSVARPMTRCIRCLSTIMLIE